MEAQFSKHISVFPNPATDLITIQLTPGSKDVVILTIADLRGKKVFQKSVSNSPNPIQMNISQLDNGIYFLTIQLGRESITRKICKAN